MNSRNSEFSEIKGASWGRPNSAQRDQAEFSRVASSNLRPSSRGILSNGQTEFSNIVSQRDKFPNDNASYDPGAAYDNLGNPYSLAYETAMDNDDQFMRNVPQGKWNAAASVDDTPSRVSTNNHSVTWKPPTEYYHGQPSSQQVDQRFWNKVSDTFSTRQDTFGKSYDSFSQGGFGNAGNYGGGGFIEESTLGSSMHDAIGNYYYGQ